MKSEQEEQEEEKTQKNIASKEGEQHGGLVTNKSYKNKTMCLILALRMLHNLQDHF